MEYKLHKCGSYNLHTIKTDKFKNIRLEVIFRNNIDKETNYLKTFLFDLLTENNLDYKTRRDLILRLEYLYNAYLYSSTNRVGASTINSIVMDFLNPKYTEDDYLEDAIKLPFEMIFNPNVVNNEFDQLTVDTLKKRVINNIKSVNEQPNHLAFKNAITEMDKNSISSINILGTETEVENITSNKLLKVYQDALTHDYVDIFVIGDIDENKIVDLVTKYAKFNTIKDHEVLTFVENKSRLTVKNSKDIKHNNQSQIVLIYNTLKLDDLEKKYAMNILDTVLGGGSLESLLYQNVRDKESLCYSIHSSYIKYDNLLVVQTSVDKKNVNKAKKIIIDTVKKLNELVNDDNMSAAVNQIISSINFGLDQPARIISNYYFNYLGLIDPIDDRIDAYLKVKLSDVKKVAHKLKINTVYVLEGDKNEEDKD